MNSPYRYSDATGVPNNHPSRDHGLLHARPIPPRSTAVESCIRKTDSIHHNHPEGVVYRGVCLNSGTVAVSSNTSGRSWCIESVFPCMLSEGVQTDDTIPYGAERISHLSQTLLGCPREWVATSLKSCGERGALKCTHTWIP